MIFTFKNSRIRKIYWKIFFIISIICFLCYISGITYFICDLIGASTDDDDLAVTSIILPILYLIFNVFIIWILELIYD
jgi:hypothetical protein